MTIENPAKFIADRLKDMDINDIIQAFDAYGVDEDSARNIFRYLIDDVDELDSAIAKLSKSGKSFGDVIKGFFISPLGKVAIAVTAVAAAAAILDAVITTPAEANEKMEKSFAKYEAAKSELESINAELETTNERINALEAKGGLSFVEKGELERLKEANDLLKIKQDLAEKEAEQAGREAAYDALVAYKKNYNYDISQSAKDDFNLEEHARNNPYNTDNVIRYLKLIDEFSEKQKNAASTAQWDDYENRIQEATDSVWNHVKTLSGYKEDLESIPRSLRTIEQKQAIKDISDDIEYIYKELDPNTWKQMKVDDIFSRDIFAKTKKDLIDLAKASDNVGISVEDIPKTLALAARGADIEVQDLVDAINSEAGILDFSEVRNQIKEAFKPDADDKTTAEWQNEFNEFTDWVSGMSEDDLRIVYDMMLNTDTAYYSLDDWKDALEAYKLEYTEFEFDISVESSGLEALNTALQETVSATGLTSESISALTSRFADLDNFDAESLFENTANGVHLNRQALEDLEVAYEKQNKQKINDRLQELIADYADLTKQMELYKDSAEYDDLLYKEQAILDEIDSVRQLEAQYNGLTSAYNKWLSAKSGPKERDSYEAVGASYEEMKSVLDQGWYGDEALNEYLDLMLHESKRTGDAVADFERLSAVIEGTSHSLRDYWDYDDAGNLRTDGLFDFLDDVNKVMGEDFAKIENGEYSFDFSGDKLEQVAEQFGVSAEMVQLFERALIDAGMAVKMGTPISDWLKEMQGAGKLSENIDLGIDIATAPLEDVRTLIDDLESERRTIDVEADPKFAEELDAQIAKCKEQYYFRLNIETDGALDKAVTAVQQIQEMAADGATLSIATDGLMDVAGQLASLPEEVQITVGVSKENVGDINKIAQQIITDSSSLSVPVNYTVGEQPESAGTIPGTVEYEGIFPEVAPTIAGKVIYDAVFPKTAGTIYGKAIYSATVTGGLVSGGIASKPAVSEGTAFADGTVNAYSFGKNGKLQNDEQALVNELGTESIVRDGRWHLIPGGAHIEKLKRGDIIFSAAQTKELIRSGKVFSGGGHGKAYADGTIGSASLLNAYDLGTGGRRPDSSKSSSGKNSGKNKDKSSKSESDTEAFDWIEVAIKRIADAIKRLTSAATSAYKSLKSKLGFTVDQIALVNEELELQEKAYTRYMEQANSVGLSSDLAKLVQTGAVDISEYDKETQELIKDYQNWYEKANECSNAIEDLHENLAELYEDNFNNIQEDFDNQLELLEHLTNSYENQLDVLEAKGYMESAEYYEALQDVEREKIEVLNKELAALEKSFSDAMNSGEIEEGSDAW